MNKRTRTVTAVLACAGIFLAYGFIGALIGFKHGGGVIPLLICFGLIAFVWKAITREPDKKDQDKDK